MVQGRGVDASLNDTGRIQAKKTYDRLLQVNFKTVFTSEMKRTKETVKSFLDDGYEHIALDGLDEISWGKMEGVKASAEDKNLYSQTVKDWRNGMLDRNVGGGESPKEVMSRQKAAIDKVLEHPSDTVLVCMHGRAMRILLCWLLNYPLNYMDGFPHRNCAYYKVIYRGNSYYIDEFNVTDHLQ